MLDRAQWFLAGISITLPIHLSQPMIAAVPVGKVVQTAQITSSDAAETEVKEALQLYRQGTAEAKRGAIAKLEQVLKLYREAGDRTREALAFSNIARVYLGLAE